jgi:hypothetical protein
MGAIAAADMDRRFLIPTGALYDRYDTNGDKHPPDGIRHSTEELFENFQCTADGFNQTGAKVCTIARLKGVDALMLFAGYGRA